MTEFKKGDHVEWNSHGGTAEATRNLLMEPSSNSDLRYAVMPPRDLTLPLLRDLGW